MDTTGAAVLAIERLGVRFGGILALEGVSFEVGAKERFGLIGPNGAGKTTLINCVTRVYEPSHGSIQLLGRSLLNEPQHRLASLGIARTFQGLAMFGSLSVRDNVLTGAHSGSRAGYLSSIARTSAQRAEEIRLRLEAEALLDALGLSDVADRQAASLPPGIQRRAEIARALAAKPKLLLLDEPAAGLGPDEIATLAQVIRALPERTGASVLLVEHNMDLVMEVCDRIAVLEFGRKLTEGSPADVQRHPEVLRAYLGRAA